MKKKTNEHSVENNHNIISSVTWIEGSKQKTHLNKYLQMRIKKFKNAHIIFKNISLI